jgi:hypothetical protein
MDRSRRRAAKAGIGKRGIDRVGVQRTDRSDRGGCARWQHGRIERDEAVVDQHYRSSECVADESCAFGSAAAAQQPSQTPGPIARWLGPSELQHFVADQEAVGALEYGRERRRRQSFFVLTQQVDVERRLGLE